MKLAIGLLLASWVPDFATASLRGTEEKTSDIYTTRTLEIEPCADSCCKATDQAASIVQSALIGCGTAATGYSVGGVVKSDTAIAYQPPNPTCLLILCAAQRSASALVQNGCVSDVEPVIEPVIGVDICEYVPGFTPPIAHDDTGMITQGEVGKFAVLENDRAVPGRYLVLNAIKTQAGNGECYIDFNEDQQNVMYKSDEDYMGEDSCEYETCYENGPRLCDTATLTINVVAAPTQSPTSAPTSSPTESCKIGLAIECPNCGDDQTLATKVPLCDDDKNRPSEMILKYSGGNCAHTDNLQENKVECTDNPDGNLPRQSSRASSYIVVSSDKGTHFEGLTEVGDFTGAFEPGDNNLKVQIFVSNGGQKLQEVVFHVSCSKELNLLDTFGAVQIASFTDSRGTVSLFGEAKLELEVSNTNVDEDVRVTKLVLESPEPIRSSTEISPNKEIGSDPVKFSLSVPIDRSVADQTYTYILTAEGDGDGRSCEGGPVEAKFNIKLSESV